MLLLLLRRANLNPGKISGAALLLVPALWLSLGAALLNERFPGTIALIDDWSIHFLYVTVFLTGFILILRYGALNYFAG